MPKAKYEQIYHILKDKIESGEYPAQALLPGEHTLIAELDCSRGHPAPCGQRAGARRLCADHAGQGRAQYL